MALLPSPQLSPFYCSGEPSKAKQLALAVALAVAMCDCRQKEPKEAGSDCHASMWHTAFRSTFETRGQEKICRHDHYAQPSCHCHKHSCDAHQRSPALTSAACCPCAQTGASEQWTLAQLSAAGPAALACLRCCPLVPKAHPQIARAAAQPAGQSACCRRKMQRSLDAASSSKTRWQAGSRTGQGNPAPVPTSFLKYG